MLTSKQRAYLIKLSNDVKALYQIGKGEISKNYIKQINDALEAKELIKINVLENSGITPLEACNEISEKTGAEPVKVIGNKIILYKESVNNKKIKL